MEFIIDQPPFTLCCVLIYSLDSISAQTRASNEAIHIHVDGVQDTKRGEVGSGGGDINNFNSSIRPNFAAL